MIKNDIIKKIGLQIEYELIFAKLTNIETETTYKETDNITIEEFLNSIPNGDYIGTIETDMELEFVISDNDIEELLTNPIDYDFDG